MNAIVCNFFCPRFVSERSLVSWTQSFRNTSNKRITVNGLDFPASDKKNNHQNFVVATTRHASNSCSNESGIYVFIEARRHFDRIICRIWPHPMIFPTDLLLGYTFNDQASRGCRERNFMTS